MKTLQYKCLSTVMEYMDLPVHKFLRYLDPLEIFYSSILIQCVCKQLYRRTTNLNKHTVAK